MLMLLFQVDYDALICQPCDVGIYPMHIAAQNGAGKVLEILIEHGNLHITLTHSTHKLFLFYI